jgi:hypothetical protein
MVNATFVGQAQGDIRQKLQKPKGFTGINACQLLEVATNVFVNQGQKARWEAKGKMKRTVDILAGALAGQSDGPRGANLGRVRSNYHGQ